MPTTAGLQLLDAARRQIQRSPFREHLAVALSPLRRNHARRSEIYNCGTIHMYVLRFFLAAPSPTTLGCAPSRRRTRVSTVCQSPLCHLSIVSVCRSTDDPNPASDSLRNLTPGPHSNPIGPRPPRQRLPPSLLIENASDPVFRPCHLSCPRRFRSRLATTRSCGLVSGLRTTQCPTAIIQPRRMAQVIGTCNSLPRAR